MRLVTAEITTEPRGHRPPDHITWAPLSPPTLNTLRLSSHQEWVWLLPLITLAGCRHYAIIYLLPFSEGWLIRNISCHYYAIYQISFASHCHLRWADAERHSWPLRRQHYAILKRDEYACRWWPCWHWAIIGAIRDARLPDAYAGHWEPLPPQPHYLMPYFSSFSAYFLFIWCFDDIYHYWYYADIIIAIITPFIAAIIDIDAVITWCLITALRHYFAAQLASPFSPYQLHCRWILPLIRHWYNNI